MVGILGQIPLVANGSALLGSGGRVSVLGVDGNGASALFGGPASPTVSLLQQVKSVINQRLVEGQDAINQQASQRNDAINVQNDRWIAVKAQVNNAQIAVENGQEALQRVQDKLLEMRTFVTNTGEPGEDAAFWRDQYNMAVNLINIEADNAGPASNLIGSINRLDYSPNQIEYRNNLAAGSTTLRGTYIGSDFRIEGTDGTVWVPDLSTDILQAYSGLQGDPQEYTTAEGDELDKATSLRNGIQLVSYNAQTKQITVNISVVPTEAPIVVTGTLKTAGNGLMGAWFYNNFATENDRKAARAAINTAAEVNLISAGADLERSAQQTGADQRRVDNALLELTQQTIKVNDDQRTATQELQIKTAQQFQAMQANLSNLAAQQQNYLQAFAGFVDDPFAQAALDITT